MKIRTRYRSYEEVMALPRGTHNTPLRPNFLLRTIVRVVSILDLIATRFTYTQERMELVKKEPCLILMNHSSFLDLMMAFGIFYPKPFSIVCTYDTLVGKSLLMRLLGCIPTQKFVSDLRLIRDMEYMLKEKKTSVLMYPEAGYSFDGTATILPRKMGILLKKLDVPVVSVITRGAFARDPLYNMLQKRRIKASAEVKCLLTREEIREKSAKELDAVVEELFSFDNFAWQQEQGIHIQEAFRSDGLHRILYKCPHCGAEGRMEGKGIILTCHSCGKQWELTTLGRLQALEWETEYPHIPDWYAWQRREVRKELEDGSYSLDTDVTIGMMVDYKALYMVGSGHLTHNTEGFTLTGGQGKLHYKQGPLACHTLNADFFWYEKGDVIGIGDRNALYYCFTPEDIPVAKARLAAEELYKLKKQRKGNPAQP